MHIVPRVPWLSVVIPTCNGEDYIRQALNSILRDDAEGIECLVIDDGSGDATRDIVSGYADQLDLRLISGPRTGNWAANSNVALRQASAAHVCYLHQDDYWLPGRAAAIKVMMSLHPHCVLYLHAALFVDAADRRLGLWSAPLPAHPARIGCEELVERLLVQNFLAICAPVFRTEQALALGGLDEHLWYAADWDFWLKLAALGDSVYAPTPLSAYRVHAQSQTMTRSVATDDFRQQLESVLAKHLVRHPSVSPLTRTVAHFSLQVNIALAQRYHDGQARLWHLAGMFAQLGWRGWARYLRDSRIAQRLTARMRLILG